MLNIGTYLRVADNSGAIWVKCLHTTKYRRGNIYPADIITIVVRKNKYKPHVVKKSKIITKGMICKALVVKTTRGVRRWGYFYIKTNSTSVILINMYKVPFATRLFGLMFRELRTKILFKKIISLAKYAI